MSWKEKMAEYGGADVTFLTEDGEQITFIICGECELVEGKYKNQPTRRIVAPVISADGFTMFVMGLRLARRLSKYEEQFNTVAFTVTRNGVKGDQNASYDLKASVDEATTKELFAYKQNEFSPDDVADALEAVREIIKS